VIIQGFGDQGVFLSSPLEFVSLTNKQMDLIGILNPLKVQLNQGFQVLIFSFIFITT